MSNPEESLNRRRVRKGARWLDEHMPNWYDLVVIGSLDMSRRCSCVLGQITGDYNYVVDAEVPTNLLPPLVDRTAVTHGFDADSGDYDLLEDLWVREIATRREGAEDDR